MAPAPRQKKGGWVGKFLCWQKTHLGLALKLTAMNLNIIGIDPGTVKTGYGLIRVTENDIKCIDYGLILANDRAFSMRIKSIHKGIGKLCRAYKPQHMAIEKVFFGKNPDTAFKLGHIFALCLLESEKRGMEFFEYPSRLVKKTVTFSGNASKELVQKFVTNFFSLPTERALDATDALAVALCHSREYKKNLFQKQIDMAGL